MENYETLGVLGEGTYGVVIKAKQKATGKVVAIKKFKQLDNEEHVKRTSMREVKMLKQLKHPNIVNLLEVFTMDNQLFLVFEYVEKTVLECLESTTRGLPPKDVRRYMYQLLRALHYCHSNNVIHRDVKPENILIGSSGAVKLCDFGFARMVTTKGKYTDYVATRWYRAPELLVGDVSYTKAVDVWAVGCIFAELSDTQPLFPGSSDLNQLSLIFRACGPVPNRMVRIFEANPLYKRVSFPSCTIQRSLQERYANRSADWLEFLCACLETDPAKRLSCAELMNLSYFTKNQFREEYERELQQMGLGYTMPTRSASDSGKGGRKSRRDAPPQGDGDGPVASTNASGTTAGVDLELAKNESNGNDGAGGKAGGNAVNSPRPSVPPPLVPANASEHRTASMPPLPQLEPSHMNDTIGAATATSAPLPESVKEATPREPLRRPSNLGQLSRSSIVTDLGNGSTNNPPSCLSTSSTLPLIYQTGIDGSAAPATGTTTTTIHSSPGHATNTGTTLQATSSLASTHDFNNHHHHHSQHAHHGQQPAPAPPQQRSSVTSFPQIGVLWRTNTQPDLAAAMTTPEQPQRGLLPPLPNSQSSVTGLQRQDSQPQLPPGLSNSPHAVSPADTPQPPSPPTSFPLASTKASSEEHHHHHPSQTEFSGAASGSAAGTTPGVGDGLTSSPSLGEAPESGTGGNLGKSVEAMLTAAAERAAVPTVSCQELTTELGDERSMTIDKLSFVGKTITEHPLGASTLNTANAGSPGRKSSPLKKDDERKEETLPPSVSTAAAAAASPHSPSGPAESSQPEFHFTVRLKQDDGEDRKEPVLVQLRREYRTLLGGAGGKESSSQPPPPPAQKQPRPPKRKPQQPPPSQRSLGGTLTARPNPNALEALSALREHASHSIQEAGNLSQVMTPSGKQHHQQQPMLALLSPGANSGIANSNSKSNTSGGTVARGSKQQRGGGMGDTLRRRQPTHSTLSNNHQGPRKSGLSPPTIGDDPGGLPVPSYNSVSLHTREVTNGRGAAFAAGSAFLDKMQLNSNSHESSSKEARNARGGNRVTRRATNLHHAGGQKSTLSTAPSSPSDTLSIGQKRR